MSQNICLNQLSYAIPFICFILFYALKCLHHIDLVQRFVSNKINHKCKNKCDRSRIQITYWIKINVEFQRWKFQNSHDISSKQPSGRHSGKNTNGCKYPGFFIYIRMHLMIEKSQYFYRSQLSFSL